MKKVLCTVSHPRAFLAFVSVGFVLMAFRAWWRWYLDDAFITFTYAKNIAEGRGFVFSGRYPTWGTSTPLFTLLMAAVHVLGGAIPVASRVVDFFAMAGQGFAGFVFLRRLDFGRWAFLPFLAIPFFDYLETSFPGMEYGLYAMCNVAALVCVVEKRWLWAAALASVAAATRTDGALVCLFVGVAWVFHTRGRSHRIAFLVLLGALPALWYAYALWQFGRLTPQTMGVRQLEAQVWGRMASYWYTRWLNPMAPGLILLPAVAGAVVAIRRHRATAWLAAYGIAYVILYSAFGLPGISCYLCTPDLVLILFVCVWIGWCLDMLTRGARTRRIGAAAILVATMLSISHDIRESAGRWKIPWNRGDGSTRLTIYQGAARWINHLVPERVGFASNEIGVLGYYAGDRLTEIGGLVNPDGKPYVPFRYPALIEKEAAPILLFPKSFFDYLISIPEGRRSLAPYQVLGKFQASDGTGAVVLIRNGLFDESQLDYHRRALERMVAGVAKGQPFADFVPLH